jgi:hypothetical protein
MLFTEQIKNQLKALHKTLVIHEIKLGAAIGYN